MPSTSLILPAQIHVETMRDDVSYSLPVRALGKLRWFGLAILAFGVAWEWMPCSHLAGFVKHILMGNGGTPEFIFACFMVPFLVVGWMPIALGLAILFGRSRVELRDRKLSASELVGPLRWRRRLQKGNQRLLKLSVRIGGAKINGQPVTSGPLADLGVLVAEFEQAKPRVVVMGYPHEWLQALAENLSARVGATLAGKDAPKVEIVDEEQAQLEIDELEKPADSKVRLEKDAKGITLVLPPAGLWRGSKGLMFFGILWCAFMTVFTTLAAGPLMHDPNAPAWAIGLFIAGFWAIGLGILAAAVNMGKRRAMIRAQNDGLKVVQQGLFGTRQWEWPREGIAAIRMDNSGMSVNDQPIKELQVHPTRGKKKGLFCGRDEDELNWMAAELRKVLQVPAR